MKKVFISPYNSQRDYISSRLLIVGDCKVSMDFVNELCLQLNTNADLLYIDTSEKTGTSSFFRHTTYWNLALDACIKKNKKYDRILFWQQFIGVYFGFLNRFYGNNNAAGVFLTPFLYKKRKGIIGKIYRQLLNVSIQNPLIKAAICHSSAELKYYSEIFPENHKKFFFVHYGQSSIFKDDVSLDISADEPYFFSGGTSNRDYFTLISAAKTIGFPFIIACTPYDIKGMNIPGNVRVFHDAFADKFDSLLIKCNAVILTLQESNVSSGQILLLKSMQLGKVIIATKSPGVTDYVDENCAFLVNQGNIGELSETMRRIISNPAEAEAKARKAKEKYQENYTVQKFAIAVSNLIVKAEC